MARVAIPLSIAALAALAACTSYDPNYPNTPVSSTSGAVTAPSSGTTVTSSGSQIGNPVVYPPAVPTAGAALVPSGNNASTIRPGNGVVESVALVHILPAPGNPSASAGAGMPERLAYRLSIKMDDDASFQAVDQDNRNFMAGDRVRLTGDGRVMRQ
jgi:outer membrane lipoprotein SlyB